MRIRTAMVIAGLLAVATLGAGDDAEQDKLRVLFPQDRALLESGKFEVIALLPETETERPPLRVDGKAVEWEPFEPPALVAIADLKPGKHKIEIGKEVLRVRVLQEGEDVPEGAKWPLFRSHGHPGDWKACAACHDVSETDGRKTLGELKEPEACLTCHTDEEFELAHFHPLDPIAACHDCHALHGGNAEALLRAPVKELCGACHD